MSTTDEDVLAVADALGEELAAADSEMCPFEFQTVLMQCNEIISEETEVQYGDACGAGGSC